MRSRSIRFRLTSAFTVILACIFLVAGVGLWLTLQQSIHHTADEELRSRLRAMRSYVELQTKGTGVWHLIHELNEDAGAAAMGSNIALADQNGKWLYRSRAVRWDLPLRSPETLAQVASPYFERKRRTLDVSARRRRDRRLNV